MNAWVEQWFDTWAADKGDVIRRNIDDVHKNASKELLLESVKARAWHLIETGNQYVVVCNSGEVRIHC